MRFASITSIIALVVLMQSTAVNAEAVRENRCIRYGITRMVELQADNESGAPCRVLYHKPMEDQSTTNLWNATNDAQFCSAKYDAFLVKLETRLNWSCEPVTSSGQSLADNQLPPESSTVTPIAPDDNESASSDSALSMNRIEQYIPSGNYVSYKEGSHSDNSPLCPADGSFNWSTQTPDKPVFEMGADHPFHFDLTSLTDIPIASVSEGTVLNQCQPKISAGYCSNGNYFGDTPLHPVLSSYFGCDGSSVSSGNNWPLILVRSLVDPDSSASECKISENYQHLALAPSPSSNGSAETSAKHDLELVIMPKRTNSNSMSLIKGYVCRYVRGS